MATKSNGGSSVAGESTTERSRAPRSTRARGATERGAERKRAYHHGDLPRALVSAALALIEKRGPEAFTLREAAAAVGVTHGAAYRHFADKNALFAAIAEEGYRSLATDIRSAIGERRGARARLTAGASAYVRFAMEHPAHYRVMSGPRLNEDGRFPALEAAIDDAFQILVAEIESGQREDVFRAGLPRDLAITIWFCAHGYTDLVLRRRIKVKSPKVAIEYFQKLLDPLLDGLSTRLAARPGA